MIKSLRIAAAALAALFAATGCVSSRDYARVTHQRDQLSSALSQTQVERDASAEESAGLATELAAAYDQSDDTAARAAATQLKLTATQADLAGVKQNLAKAQQANA